MSPAESEQFEAHLADDQAAREALSRAVELTQLIAAAESQTLDFVTPAVAARGTWNVRLSWMAVGGLASVLLAMLWSGLVGPTWRNAAHTYRSESRANLALAWSETRAQIASVREAGLWPSSVGQVEADDWPLEQSPLDESLDDAPSWLTAAVVSMSAGGGSSSSPADPSES